MARPRSFDLDVALDDALDVFWTRGYESTSIGDLKAAMGIETGSLYKAFGSKKELFQKALLRYLEQGRRAQAAPLEGAANVLEGFTRLLDQAAIMATEGGRRGCFAINCSIDAAPHDPDVLRILKDHDRAMMRLLSAHLEKGQMESEICDERPPKDLARFVFTTIAGLQVQGRSGASQRALRAAANVAASSLAP